MLKAGEGRGGCVMCGVCGVRVRVGGCGNRQSGQQPTRDGVRAIPDGRGWSLAFSSPALSFRFLPSVAP